MSRPKKVSTIAGLVLALFAWVGFSRASPSIEVTDAWSLPAVVATGDSDAVGVAYFRIVNRGSAGDRLMRVRTNVCRSAELHETKQTGDVMRMEPIAGGLEVPAGESVQLKPGGKHLMLIGLRRSLSPGDRFTIELDLQKGGTLSVESIVRGP